MKEKRRNISAVVVLLMLAFGSLWYCWTGLRLSAYNVYREHDKEKALSSLQGYQQERSAHFVLYYTESDSEVVNLILEIAEEVYLPVTTPLGFLPPESIPIILYPTRERLRYAFGWGQEQSAVGVYWNGTIRLLSPNVWITGQGIDVQQTTFRRLNPIAHELTHYVLDYLTAGNYPRWFSEGLAQYMEYHISGYLWLEAKSSLRQQLYTLSDMQDQFESLPNQPLAYRQSYLLVSYMAETYGKQGLSRVIEQISTGIDFPTAVQEVSGRSVEMLFSEWMMWIQERFDELDSPM